MRKNGKKTYYIGEFVLFSTILNRTIPGIVLSEIVLSGDPLYIEILCDSLIPETSVEITFFRLIFVEIYRKIG